MTTTIDSTKAETAPTTDPYGRVLDNLDANFGVAPSRRAAHAKGVVVTGFFSPTAEASEITRAGHLTGTRTPVVARFSSFPGGADHPDTAPEANPRGLAVQFRLTQQRRHHRPARPLHQRVPRPHHRGLRRLSRRHRPRRTGPEDYLAGHPAAAAFVHAIQSHGVPASFATLCYCPSTPSASRPRTAPRTSAGTCGCQSPGSTCWTRKGPPRRVRTSWLTSLPRLAVGRLSFVLELQLAEPGDVHRRRQCPVAGRSSPGGARDAPPDRSGAGQRLRRTGPVLRPRPARRRDHLLRRPLLVGRTRTYPLSLARRHTDG